MELKITTQANYIFLIVLFLKLRKNVNEIDSSSWIIKHSFVVDCGRGKGKGPKGLADMRAKQQGLRIRSGQTRVLYRFQQEPFDFKSRNPGSFYWTALRIHSFPRHAHINITKPFKIFNVFYLKKSIHFKHTVLIWKYVKYHLY